MATHAQVEAWWAGYRCDTSEHVSLDMNGRYPVRVQAPLRDAAVALSEAIMDSGYRTPMGPTGSYNCRKISGTDTWSLHAYAVAIDWDYGENPYLRGTSVSPGFGTDSRFMLTEAQVNAVEAIVNEDGDSIWRWLGWTIGDYMHFQVDVPPNKCQPKESTVPTYKGVKNVPNQDWAHNVVDWGLDTGVIMIDTNPDWDRTDYSDGRLWSLLNRFAQSLDE